MEYHLPLPEWLIFLIIHVLVPLIGVAFYVLLGWRLHRRGESPAVLYLLFVLFFCWGGMLLITLTACFWYWSGMASLGTFFVLLVSPFVVAPVAIALRRRTQQVSLRRAAGYAATVYYFYLAAGLAILILSGSRR